MIRKIFSVENSEITGRIFGTFDSNAAKIEEAFGVRIFNRSADADGMSSDGILIEGESESVEKAYAVISYLYGIARRTDIPEQSVDYAISMIGNGKSEELEQLDGDTVAVTLKGKPIKPKTVGQKRYTDKIKNSTIVFGIGPAGTGRFRGLFSHVPRSKRENVSASCPEIFRVK